MRGPDDKLVAGTWDTEDVACSPRKCPGMRRVSPRGQISASVNSLKLKA
jgi:hypothetical protein